jgi:flagellar biosynthesis chaperone FliJ
MKSLVITILDDVCAKNGKDPEATQLIEVARSYGKVETLDAVLATERMKYQEVTNNLRAQLDACAEYGVTNEELEILRAIRKKSDAEAEGYKKEIETCRNELASVTRANEAQNASILAIINKGTK